MILILFLVSLASAEEAAPPYNCQLVPCSGGVRPYPSSDNYRYAINYNSDTQQAHYVTYLTHAGYEGNRECNHWHVDPYGINPTRSSWYDNTGYDRGHLVPYADYGCDTMIMTNVVPMLPRFNRDYWEASENHIRSNYNGMLTAKGCDYNGGKISSPNKLNIPTGCYYVVFNSTRLPHPLETVRGSVLDYGYIQNSIKFVFKKMMPHWLNCKGG